MLCLFLFTPFVPNEGEGKCFICYPEEQILVLDLIRIWFSIFRFNTVMVNQMSSLRGGHFPAALGTPRGHFGCVFSSGLSAVGVLAAECRFVGTLVTASQIGEREDSGIVVQ